MKPEQATDDSSVRLGDYELIAELGRGGMGRVFLARRSGQRGFERLFAIKVLAEDMVDEAEALLMFLDEANIASRIHHPNVVATVDVGKASRGHYMVLEYVEGCSLDQLLRKHPEDRPPRLLVPVVLDALRGLHAAHELTEPDGKPSNLVHRDFSPQNLLIGVDGTCRVTDFGVAKVAVRLTQTQHGVNKGKLSYMSPEQLSAARDIDRRADLWAAGVVLWSALTGVHLFRGQSEAETVTNILRLEVPRPSSVGLRPPPCFDELCLKALSRRRSERFETAQEMADELHAVAVRQDLLGTPSEVARWVKETFEEALAVRRGLIRELRRAPSATRLPVLEGMAPPLTPPPRPVEELSGEATAPAGSTPLPAQDERKDESTAVTAVESKAPQPSPPPTPEPSPPPPSPGPEPLPARRSRAPVVAGLIALLVALLVGLGFAVSAGIEDTRPQPSSQLPPLRPASDAPAEPPPGPEPEGAAAGELLLTEPASAVVEPAGEALAEIPRVQVTLEGLPEGARVSLDGVVVDGRDLGVPGDGRERLLKVEAEGARAWTRKISPRSNSSYAVELEPRRRRSGAKRAPELVRDPGF